MSVCPDGPHSTCRLVSTDWGVKKRRLLGLSQIFFCRFSINGYCVDLQCVRREGRIIQNNKKSTKYYLESNIWNYLEFEDRGKSRCRADNGSAVMFAPIFLKAQYHNDAHFSKGIILAKYSNFVFPKNSPLRVNNKMPCRPSHL